MFYSQDVVENIVIKHSSISACRMKYCVRKVGFNTPKKGRKYMELILEILSSLRVA
jgi:hypothetical protein